MDNQGYDNQYNSVQHPTFGSYPNANPNTSSKSLNLKTMRDFNYDDLDKVFSSFIADIQKLRKDGEKEYAGGAASFGNFNRLSQRLGIPRGKVLLTYYEKHMDGILSYLNGHRFQREPIRGRFGDAIVYLILLYGMFMEDLDNGVDRTAVVFSANPDRVG